MKWSSFAPLLAAIALLPHPQAAIAQSLQNTTFFCGKINGIPATIARTPNGQVPMVLWNSPGLVLSNYSPQQLCEQVSERFQIYYNQGELNYITTGTINRQLVACATTSEEEGCGGRLLFALKKTQPPREALERILRIRVPYEDSIHETPLPLSVNLEQYLNGEYPSE